jgi:hypothetical protein
LGLPTFDLIILGLHSFWRIQAEAICRLTNPLPDWLDEHTVIIVEGNVIVSNNRPTLGIRHKALRENSKMYLEGWRKSIILLKRIGKIKCLCFFRLQHKIMPNLGVRCLRTLCQNHIHDAGGPIGRSVVCFGSFSCFLFYNTSPLYLCFPFVSRWYTYSKFYIKCDSYF